MELIYIRRKLMFGKKSKNLIGPITAYDRGWIGSSGTITTTGETAKRGMILPPITVQPSTAYTMSWNGVTPYSMSACEYNGNTFIRRNHQATDSGSPRSITFTTGSNCSSVVLQYYYMGGGSLDVLKSIKPMLEIGSELTPYEP